MKIINTTIIALFCFALPYTSGAAEYSVYQDDIIAPYSFYKKSLALTSKKENKDKAIQIVEKFIAGWTTIVEKYRQDPPAEFKQIADFQEKLSRPVAVGEEALRLLQAGEVKKSHHVLEEVRYLLWRMRVDTGIVSLNDKVNDFHEAMEVILDKVAESRTPEQLKDAGQRYGAWVAIKWQEVAGSTFTGSDKAPFDKALADGKKAIADLLEACRKGDLETAKKAGGMVKKSYKNIFFLPEVR